MGAPDHGYQPVRPDYDDCHNGVSRPSSPAHHDDTGGEKVRENKDGDDDAPDNGIAAHSVDTDNDSVNTDNDTSTLLAPLPPAHASRIARHKPSFRLIFIAMTCLALICLAVILVNSFSSSIPLAKADADASSCHCPSSTSSPPQYFQTSPELWPGPTVTGAAALLAQTRVFDASASYHANQPLQTSIPVAGMSPTDDSIFSLMGNLSPYKPSSGFGVEEYPLPPGATITQMQMLSRHGARYPTSDSPVAEFGRRIANASSGQFKPKDSLAFLAEWKYELGAEILVPKGRQELFDSGVLHSYMYGAMYNPQSKIIVRTTTQDRMLKSAENWLAGFFGLEWTNNATIEVIIEEQGSNNTLSGSLNCPNAFAKSSAGTVQDIWTHKYLRNATRRFQSMTDGFDWTVDDVYAAQTMCPYETVAYGYSRFCDLFTYQEWQDFSYSIDLAFSALSSFHSPTGRAAGIGYQQEVIARLKNHTLGYSGSQINVTLDSSTTTFPLNQTLYFDFAHDTTIVSVLTAFGLRQFADKLPPRQRIGRHNFTVSNLTPFGARLDIEIIQAPMPVSPDRRGYLQGNETTYVHFVLNQRTVPLGQSFPECDASRKDGWCELETFLKVQQDMTSKAQFEYACFGSYTRPPYVQIVDGVPPR